MNKNRNDKGFYSCFKCKNIEKEKTCIKKYGVKSYSMTDEFRTTESEKWKGIQKGSEKSEPFLIHQNFYCIRVNGYWKNGFLQLCLRIIIKHMRRILLSLCLFLVLTPAQAQTNSNLTISTTGNSNLKIRFDCLAKFE